MRYENIGTKLRNIRKMMGLGIKTVAPKIGIHYSYLSKLESGMENPSPHVLEKLINFYRLNSEQVANLLSNYKLRRGVINLETNDDGTNQKAQMVNVNINPVNTPTLYADMIQINANDNGFVLNFVQQMGPTNQFNVVSRIGMSKDHIERLILELDKLIKLREGQSQTSKIKIVA